MGMEALDSGQSWAVISVITFSVVVRKISN